MVKVICLTVNQQTNPIGIEKEPAFSWKIDSDASNIIQTDYQLQVAFDPDFQQMVLDQKEQSDQSSFISCSNLVLQSVKKYFWRVKIKVNTGEESDTSDTASFVTGILNPEEWKACFISAENPVCPDQSAATYLRKDFQVKSKIRSAYICTTALGLYQLYLDGNKVGDDEMAPGWTSYHKHLCYQMYDITHALQLGTQHCVGAIVGAGYYKGKMGFMHRRNNYGDRTAFYCQIIISYEDGEQEVIASDSTFQGARSPILFSEIYDGEQYDARMEIDGWCQFEQVIPNQWNPVLVVDFDNKTLTAQSGGTIQRKERFSAKLLVTPRGELVADFGQNMAGWVFVKLKNTQAGDQIVITCFETLDSDGNVYLDNLRTAKASMTYICKGAKEELIHPHFCYMGFRYARFTNLPKDIAPEDIWARALYSDMEQTGNFVCSNPDINQLWSNITWSLKSNFFDIPTDCPQRDERLGWTGDAQIFCRTASYMMNTYTFYRKWLIDVAADQTAEGGVPHVVPDILTGYCKDDWLLGQGSHSAAAWGDVATILPWTMYLTFGDLEVLRVQYQSMKNWIDFMTTHSEGLIWNYKLQFGDWVALDAEKGSYFGATPNDLTCTAYYAYSTGIFAKTAEVLGRKEDAKKYKDLYDKIVAVYQNTFFNDQGHLVSQTQTAQIVTLYFGLCPKEYTKNLIDDLRRLLQKEEGHLVTGFVGTPYFCHVLSQNGCSKEAFDLLLKEDYPSWLYEIKKGATTIWEHWDGIKPDGTMWSADMNSYNHYAYGAVGEWMFRAIAGIEIDEEKPGYKHIIIAPHIGGNLNMVEATYDSVYGVVGSHWTVDDRQITLTIQIPCNTTCTVCLYDAEQVMESGGIRFEEKDGVIQGDTGSGKYIVKYEIA